MTSTQRAARNNLNDKLEDAQSFLKNIVTNIRNVDIRNPHEQRMMHPVSQWLGGLVTLGGFNAGSRIAVASTSKK